MHRCFVRFKRKHNNNSIIAPILIAIGLLLTLIFVPFWAFMALIGIGAVGIGVYFLISR